MSKYVNILRMMGARVSIVRKGNYRHGKRETRVNPAVLIWSWRCRNEFMIFSRQGGQERRTRGKGEEKGNGKKERSKGGKKRKGGRKEWEKEGKEGGRQEVR